MSGEEDHVNVHLLKDIVLTSHSPFIISDCLPENVILFEKGVDGQTTATKARDLGIDTHGTSVNIISSRVFSNSSTIGTLALSKLNDYKHRLSTEKNFERVVDEINEEFGDSIEKLLIITEAKSARK